MAGSPGGSTSPYQAGIPERSMGNSQELGLHSWHSFGQGTRFCRTTNSVFEDKVTEAAPAEKPRKRSAMCYSLANSTQVSGGPSEARSEVKHLVRSRGC